MPQDNVIKFYDAAQANVELGKKVENIKNPEDLIGIAAEAGFDITIEDLIAAEQELRKNVIMFEELSLDALEEVSGGGGAWEGQNAEDGHEMGCIRAWHDKNWQEENNVFCVGSYYTRDSFENRSDCNNSFKNGF